MGTKEKYLLRLGKFSDYIGFHATLEATGKEEASICYKLPSKEIFQDTTALRGTGTS
jgi:hypothetical protein